MRSFSTSNTRVMNDVANSTLVTGLRRSVITPAGYSVWSPVPAPVPSRNVLERWGLTIAAFFSGSGQVTRE